MNIAKHLLLAALFSVGLVGCVTDDQLNPVRTFATAASSFSTDADSAMVKVNDSFVERNMAKVASGDGAVTDATFVGVLDNEPGFKASEDALKTLGKYAASLNALATAGYAADVDKATTALYGSLTAIRKDATSLDPKAANISDADLGILATAVKAIGEEVAREKQLAAIKQAVVTAEPGVQTVCAGIGSTLADLQSTYLKNLNVIYTAKFTAYQSEAPKLSFNDRLARLQELRTTKQSINDADAFLAKLSESAKNLAAAHTKIKQSLTEQGFNLAEVVKAVGELKSSADELKTFYANLTKGT